MTSSVPAVRRALAVGVAGGAMLLVGPAVAVAEPPPACTAADLARVSAGVSNATADYLSGQPEVNAFFTGLKGQGPEELEANVESYLDANPQIRDQLQSIRQPLADFESRCL